MNQQLFDSRNRNQLAQTCTN